VKPQIHAAHSDIGSVLPFRPHVHALNENRPENKQKNQRDPRAKPLFSIRFHVLFPPFSDLCPADSARFRISPPRVPFSAAFPAAEPDGLL
jgi:hypothetical protein